jgi:hypothetical protein
MKLKILTLFIICFSFSVLLYSQNTKTVPFTSAKNYYVKNTFQNSGIQFFKILSMDELNKVMGMATVMGEDGRPTNIDFKKQFAIVVIHYETDTMTELLPTKLLLQGKRSLVFEYKKKLGDKTTYTTKPFMFILVDEKYRSRKLSIKQTKDKE